MYRHLLVVSLALWSSPASSQGVEIKNGFATGEAYLKMRPNEQKAYAIGLVNGLLLAPMFGAPRSRMLRLENCITGMSDSQVTAILTKYLQDNPTRWHETPHVPMYSAMMDACPK